MDMSEKKFPSCRTALATLRWAGKLNPGDWIQHSIVAGKAAARIARAVPGMEVEKARVCCLLHDIGRYVGIVKARHQIEGYRFCMARGWDDVARICLTHTYPLNDIRRYNEYWDISDEEKRFLAEFIASTAYTDYDRLGQLVDYLALPTGSCIIEKRRVDVGRRHGVDESVMTRWTQIFEIKAHFDALTGVNIYSLLPGIAANTIR